jgi:hypothetical protein
MNVSLRQTTRRATIGRNCRHTLPSAAIKDATCRCRFCSSEFRYPDFRDGEILLCPFCGLETVPKTDLEGRKSFAADKFPVEVGELEWFPGPLGVRYIAGNLFNHSRDELCWIKIEFELFDDSALLLGRAWDHVRSLTPGQIWTFKVPVLKASASRALLFDVACEYGSIYSPGDWTGSTGAVWRPAKCQLEGSEHVRTDAH